MLYGHIAGKHHKLVPDNAPLAVNTEVIDIASTATTSAAIGPPPASIARLSTR
jgi:hypothetical protein